MKFIFTMLTAAVLSTSCIAQKSVMEPYKNEKLPVAQRVADLLKRMTIEEKAGQLNQLNGGAFTGPALNDMGQQGKMKAVQDGLVGSMLNVNGVAETKAIQQVAIEKSRLGIPLLFAYDVIHGYKTIFPIPLAEACSWNLKQVEKNASVAALEAAASGIHWTFAPMCDLSNDPRWGRVMEGIGEDPWYGGLLSAARVKGFQGNLSENNILACVKHYAAYGLVEAGREYNVTDVSRTALWNKYMPPYKKAVEAGAFTVMNGFTTLDGVPVSASQYLVTDVLKNKWNFKGLLVSDWNSFGEMIKWGYAADEEDVALKAFKAGSMIDMESQVMYKNIPGLVKKGKITEKELDDAVGRILTIKFKLGLFDDPYKYADEEREKNNILTAANRREALNAAQESVVLLKNEHKALPVSNSAKVALVGVLADSKEDMYDFWIGKGDAQQAVSLREGLADAHIAHTYSKGYRMDGTADAALIEEAVNAAKNADAVLVNIGISGKLAGEDRSLANPVVPQNQVALVKALKQTGKPVVAIVSAGRPLILTELLPHVDAILYTWILGIESGNAIVNVISGKYNPSGKTVMSFPYAVGQIPVYYNHFNTGRPTATDGAGNWYSRYRDIPNEPLYAFGYGLSYTTFSYGKIKLSHTKLKKGERLAVEVAVTNTGDRDGEEVVQLYIRDITASIIRPVKELKGFEKIALKKGETKTVKFTLGATELSFYNEKGDQVLEPGKFEVYVGGSSKDVQGAGFEVL
ncbi:MAG: glycoside hydrolase family 3 N-terminal domain-containing protein [Niabella sp.]